jgi:hypothetical protein
VNGDSSRESSVTSWEHLLTLLASYSMFGLLKGSMSFDDSVFWRMVFEIFGHGLLLFWWLQV